MNTNSSPGKFPAYLAILIGVLLLVAGLAAGIGYLSLPFTLPGGDVFSAQLGQIAGMYIGLICGPLAIYHGVRSIANRPSGLFKLPPFYFFWIVFAVVLGLGNVLLINRVAEIFLFPPIFVLGAGLPALAVVAWAARRLGWPVTWRQAAFALVAGSTLSILVAIVAETLISFIIYLLTAPLWGLTGFGSGPDILARLFFSPSLLLFLLITSLQAPMPEEFAKVLSLPLFGRGRLLDERQAFMIGLLSGAGFAVLENMLYEGLYAQYNGWSWGGIALLRGIGAVLHPLCTAIVAVGWFRAREGGPGKLLKAYALAVGLHTLWNGGFQSLVYITGLDYYGRLGSSLDFYGTTVEALLIVYLIALSLSLWMLLRHRVRGLAKDEAASEAPSGAPSAASSRLLAGWAFACTLLIVPIGAVLGGSWTQINSVVAAGPVFTPAITPTLRPTHTTASTPTTEPTLTPIPTPVTGYSDSFDSKDILWAEGTLTTQLAAINKEISGGVYHWTIKANGPIYHLVPFSAKITDDFELAVDSLQLSGPKTASYGLVFRKVDNNNFYAFYLIGEQLYGFALYDDGDLIQLIAPKKSDLIRPGEINRLAVSAKGARFTLFINGGQVAELENAKLAQGTVRLIASLAFGGEKGEFAFDNFEVNLHSCC